MSIQKPDLNQIYKWLTITNIIIFLGFLVGIAKWQQTVDDQLLQVKDHILNTRVHMDLERKYQLFTPRTEIDIRLKNIEDLIIKIEKKLDNI